MVKPGLFWPSRKLIGLLGTVINSHNLFIMAPKKGVSGLPYLRRGASTIHKFWPDSPDIEAHPYLNPRPVRRTGGEERHARN